MNFTYHSNYDTYPVENIFGVDTQQSLAYVPSNYQTSLARLEITIGTEIGFEPLYKLIFSGVIVMNIHSRWENTHFALAAPEDCISIVKRFQRYKDFSNADILQRFALYHTNTLDDFDLSILASTASIHQHNAASRLNMTLPCVYMTFCTA